MKTVAMTPLSCDISDPVETFQDRTRESFQTRPDTTVHQSIPHVFGTADEPRTFSFFVLCDLSHLSLELTHGTLRIGGGRTLPRE